jgi:predicted transcriptional regulator
MEVHLNPQQVSKLAQLASERGRDADSLAQEAISRYLEEEARFVEAVKLGESQLERGEYLTHEEVGSRIERMLKS